MLVEKSFTLEQANHLPATMLDNMLLVIKDNLPAYVVTNEVIARSKFILTELLTNAIKHANATDTNIKIEASETFIRFIKTDSGKPFKAPGSYSQLFRNASIVAEDIMHTLYAVNKKDRLHFYCYENREPSINFNSDFPEHFGLLIITKASDEFYYTYDPQKNLNFFVAGVKL